MNFSRRRFITITAGATLAARTGIANIEAANARTANEMSEAVTWRGVALGAETNLVFTGLPEPRARQLINMARVEIDRLENIFSLYRDNSALVRLNRVGYLQSPPPEMLTLLAKTSAVHHASNGLFDPTIQRLWASYAKYNGKPSQPHMQAALSLTGWQHVHFDNAAIYFAKAGMQLTLNGIAQGFITDSIVALMRLEGLQNAIVDVGEIAAIGKNQNGKSWPVGIVNQADERSPHHVRLSDKAIATSALLGTTFDGHTGHILNPRTGLPAAPKWRQVSVIHPSAALADGLSTAFTLMTASQIRRARRAFGNAKVMTCDHDNNWGVIA